MVCINIFLFEIIATDSQWPTLCISLHCLCSSCLTDFQVVIIEPDRKCDHMFDGALGPVSYQISDFYWWNNVQTFNYNKAFHHPVHDKENEFKVGCTYDKLFVNVESVTRAFHLVFKQSIGCCIW